MTRHEHVWEWGPVAAALAALLVTGWILGHGDAHARRHARRPSVKGQLRGTASDPNAQGNFEENVEDGLPDGSGEIQGDLKVTARKLAPKSTFHVNVGGVAIGVLKTNRGGSGRARFSSRPRGRTQALPVDPRGRHLSVTDAAGEGVMEGDVSDPTTPGGVQCCLNTHDQSGDQQGCDVLLAAACAAAGGTNQGSGTCEPDPCPQTGSDGEQNGGPGDSAAGAETGEH